jgi:excisionase family DNA binding protein
MKSMGQMTTKKEQIIKLKQMHLKNAEIARLLDVSRQYVSHVCQTPSRREARGKRAGNNKFLTTSSASRILGVSEATIRRWSDQGKIPSFRVDIGRRDRNFHASDLKKIILTNGSTPPKVSWLGLIPCFLHRG